MESERFDTKNEQVTTREQAIVHLERVLEVGGSFNPSSHEADVHEVPDSATDLVIFFRTDAGEYATVPEPYWTFLRNYELRDGTIPSYNFKVDDWSGCPCLKVRMSE